MSESTSSFLFGTTDESRGDKPSGPSPSDKYLPAWVVICMVLAVLLLNWQMTSAIKNICEKNGQCADFKQVTSKSNNEANSETVSTKAPTSGDGTSSVAPATATTSAPASTTPAVEKSR